MKLQYTVSDDKKFLATKYAFDEVPFELFSTLNRRLWDAGCRVIMRGKGFVDPSIGFRYIQSTSYAFFNHKPHSLEDFKSFELSEGPDIDIESYFLATFEGHEITLEKVGPEKFDQLVLNDFKLRDEGRIASLGDAHLESADEAADCITRESTLTRGSSLF